MRIPEWYLMFPWFITAHCFTQNLLVFSVLIKRNLINIEFFFGHDSICTLMAQVHWEISSNILHIALADFYITYIFLI